MRWEVKVTVPQGYCISVPHDTALEIHAAFTRVLLSTSCFILFGMNGKIKKCVSIKICVKLSKSTTKTHEMLQEAFGEQSSSWTVVLE
jgi:hypothetical protein